MIELSAVTYSDVGVAIRHQREAVRRPRAVGMPPKYYIECGRGVSMGISMSVSGNEPLEPFVYDTPEISLICRTDLLSLDRELQESFKSCPARSLAGLYQRYGDSFAKELRGSFAVILYDKKIRTLKAWIDQFGVERLVFTNAQGFVAVATDIRLLLPLLSRRPDLDGAALQEYLQYTCIPAPKTIFSGISRLEAGHQLTTRPTPVTRAYWDMNYRELNESRTEQAWAADTLSALRSSVSLNLAGVDSAQLGCFLSGGTDSSSIVGLVSQSAKQSARTFSIGFDDPRYNEMHYARLAAAHNKSEHHEYFVKPRDILSLLEKAVQTYDEPFGNSSIVPTYYCARLASENGVTHLLAGDGGDELFAGNSRYVEDRVFQYYSSIPLWMRRLLLEPAVSFADSRLDVHVVSLAARYIRRSNIRVPDRFLSYSLLSSVPGTELFAADFLATLEGHHPLTPARNHFAGAPADNDLNRWLYVDMKITIADNDLRKVTAMSRLAGVTPRYPMLEPGLAEFTGTIPAHLKLRKSRLRYLFKKAMAGILPPDIIRKTKHGFGLPYSVWVGEDRELQDFTFDVLGSTRSRQRGYFRQDLLEWLWSQYKTVHRTYFGDLLWMFLMLELWHQKHRDSAPATQASFVPVMQHAH